MKRVFDTKVMQVMALFEQTTGAQLHDCIIEEELTTFVVEENQMGKAIGKQGRNIQKIEKALKRRVKIVEYSAGVETFVKNVYYPLKAQDVRVEGDIVIVTPEDANTRGRMIGRSAQTLRRVESIVQRYFPIKEIKIETPHN